MKQKQQFRLSDSLELPSAVDLEKAVISCCLISNETAIDIVSILRSSNFYNSHYRIIYEAIEYLVGINEIVDLLTVVERLKKIDKLNIVGGPYQISVLSGEVAATTNAEAYARIVIEKYLRRKQIDVYSRGINLAFEESFDVFESMEQMEESVFALNNMKFAGQGSTTHDVLREAIDKIGLSMQLNQSGEVIGLPSGFRDLDEVTAGFQPSDLVIIAARPGMGKTAFVLSIARHVCFKSMQSVAFFSLEMSRGQLMNRVISAETGISSQKMKTGDLTKDEFAALKRQCGAINNNLIIDDNANLTISELRSKSRKMKREQNIQLIILDYIQLMNGSGGKNGREQEISEISRNIKILAKELNIPILALSQLSRAVETRGGDKRPKLSDLRESGSIEQDADIVMFLFRPEYYNFSTFDNGDSTEGIAEIDIQKHRNGPLKTVKIAFDAERIQFLNKKDYVPDDFTDVEDRGELF